MVDVKLGVATLNPLIGRYKLDKGCIAMSSYWMFVYRMVNVSADEYIPGTLWNFSCISIKVGCNGRYCMYWTLV